MTTITKAYKYIKKKGCLNNLQHQTQENNHMFHRPMIWFFSWKLPWMEGRFSRWSGIIVFLGNYFVLKEGYPTHLFSWKLPWMEGRFSHWFVFLGNCPEWKEGFPMRTFYSTLALPNPDPKAEKIDTVHIFIKPYLKPFGKQPWRIHQTMYGLYFPEKNLWHSFTIPRNCMTINPFKSIHLFTTLIITKHLSYSKPWMKPFVLWRSQWNKPWYKVTKNDNHQKGILGKTNQHLIWQQWMEGKQMLVWNHGFWKIQSHTKENNKW